MLCAMHEALAKQKVYRKFKTLQFSLFHDNVAGLGNQSGRQVIIAYSAKWAVSKRAHHRRHVSV